MLRKYSIIGGNHAASEARGGSFAWLDVAQIWHVSNLREVKRQQSIFKSDSALRHFVAILPQFFAVFVVYTPIDNDSADPISNSRLIADTEQDIYVHRALAISTASVDFTLLVWSSRGRWVRRFCARPRCCRLPWRHVREAFA